MSDHSIHIEYNQELQPLEELLSGVERAGDFSVHGVLEIPLPKLEVTGVGVVSFPVSATQITALIQQATRAPYGRGEDTLLDESVRKVWQLTPEQVRIGGKSWPASFDRILAQVVAGLGCARPAVSAEFYKLLVYDTGGFFLAHRDTEKAGGMFGTLVLVLPSAHRGGELVIRHAGRECVVDLSGMEFSEVGLAAFYADCEHEVRPITEGTRVCLVFNLIQPPAAKGKVETLQAPDYEKEIAAAAALLKNQLGVPSAPAKIAWLLEHHYSPEGLSFAGLKSADAARVKVLTQAAERAGCATHLGIVHIEESGAAQENYEPRSRRGRYRDDDEETAGATSENFEVIEVSDWRHFVSQWRDQRDQPVEFGEIPLAPGELLPAGALDDEKPDKQRLMEASGNEGASFERSYHRAALVIWRRERYAEVLLQAGVAAVLPYLKEQIAASAAPAAPAATRRQALALARMLVQSWPVTGEFAVYPRPNQTGKRETFLRLLNQLGDPTLLEEFLAGVVTRDYDGSENAVLVAAAPLLGPPVTARCLTELVRLKMPALPGHCVDLLQALNAVPAFKLEAKQEWLKALREVANAAVSQLDAIAKSQPMNAWPDYQLIGKTRPVDALLVANLLAVLGELDAPALRSAAAGKFAARPDVFDPVTVLVPALGLVQTREAAVAQLWDHCAAFLLKRSGQPPTAPTDWRQDVQIACKCADCRELQAFAREAGEQTHRFRVRLDRRQHLHQQIEAHKLDMTHVTERKGSPQTLVCTKDRRSYQQRCDQYRKDIAALGHLAEQARQSHSPNPAHLPQLAVARQLAEKWSPAETP
jgi:hypothetical protein